MYKVDKKELLPKMENIRTTKIGHPKEENRPSETSHLENDCQDMDGTRELIMGINEGCLSRG